MGRGAWGSDVRMGPQLVGALGVSKVGSMWRLLRRPLPAGRASEAALSRLPARLHQGRVLQHMSDPASSAYAARADVEARLCSAPETERRAQERTCTCTLCLWLTVTVQYEYT